MRPHAVAFRTEGQRLALALVLALAVHAMLIFGTRFTLLSTPPTEPPISVQLSWLPQGDGRPAMTPLDSGSTMESKPVDSGSSPASAAEVEAVPAGATAPAEEALAEPLEATIPQAAEPAPAATANPTPPTTPVPKAALSRPKAEAAPTMTVPKRAEKTSDKPVSPPASGKALPSRPEQPGAKLPTKPALPKPAVAESEQADGNTGTGWVGADKPAPGKLPAARLGSLELLNRGLEMARNTTPPESQAGSPWEKPGNSPSLTSLKNFYEESWARKVERLGSIPAEALRLNLSIGPTLAVAIRADGSVQSITVLRSSGHASIDEAARSMVQAAAPYAPFPPELRRQTSVLRIVRKWKFEHGRMLSD